MAVAEGEHAGVGFRVEYDVTGNAIHYRATFADGRPASEGQFDFDAGRLDADAAVRAYLANAIAKPPPSSSS